MKVDQAVEFFGNQSRVAEALGVTRAAVSRWKSDGQIPLKKAVKLQELSGNQLIVRLQDYAE